MSSSSFSGPLLEFLHFYKHTFCTFNLSVVTSESASTLLDTITSMLDAIPSGDPLASYQCTHIDIDMFPHAYTPLQYQHDEAKTSTTLSLLQIAPSHKTSSNTLVFSISTDGKIIGKDLLHITDNILNIIPHRPVALHPLHDIQTELATLLSNHYAIDMTIELESIIDRAMHLRNFYHTLSTITCQFIQLSMLYQDAACILDNPTYFLDSEPYKNAFLQSKFALEKYIYFCVLLHEFNQSISLILSESPYKTSHFISLIHKKIDRFIAKLQRLTYLYSYFISNPYYIKKYITSPQKHASSPIIQQKTVTFRTLHKFLSKNVDPYLHSDLLSALLSAHRAMTCNLFFLYRFLQ